MNGGNTRTLQTPFQTEIEIRRVDADEDIRPRACEVSREISAQTQQSWQMSQHLDEAHDRKFLDGVQRVTAYGLHAHAGNTFELRIGKQFTQRFDQAGTEQISGGLARDDGDAHKNQ